MTPLGAALAVGVRSRLVGVARVVPRLSQQARPHRTATARSETGPPRGCAGAICTLDNAVIAEISAILA